MKTFIFRLQILLDQACQAEESEACRLAALQRQRAVLIQQMTTVQASRAELGHVMLAMQATVFDARELQQLYWQMDALGCQAGELTEAIQQSDTSILAQQARVTAAMRQRQIYERLREKQAETHRLHAERSEHKAIEDSVLPRYARAQVHAQHAHAASTKTRGKP